MKIRERIRITAKSLRYMLRLSPMYKVFRKLKRRGIDPKTLDALEVFGSDGQNHTKDIASVVSTLEIWEIRGDYEPILKRNFPQAEIKITDSYAEIKKNPRKYGLVVIDNTGVAFKHHEHFDLFPDVFRILSDPSVIILNVIPQVALRESERLHQRQIFYDANDPANITFEEIERTYSNLATQNDWTMEWIFFERRWTFFSRLNTVYYAVLKLKRRKT